MPATGVTDTTVFRPDGSFRPATTTLTANRTLTAADSGKVFITGAADLVVTLPPTRAGLMFTFVVRTLSTTTGLSISPQPLDQIIGGGVTPADDKDLINTGSTDVVGDTVTLVGDGVDGYLITNLSGTWARQA
jgi:hypothetical protein